MSTIDPANDPRPAARPAGTPANPGQPASAAKPGGGLSLTGIGCLAIIVVPLVGFVIWLLLGSPGSASQLCIDAIEENYYGVFESPRETDRIENAIAVDVRGSFDGGTYACGLSKDPLTVEQAIVYTRDGTPIIVVP